MTLLAIIRIRKRQSHAYILEALMSWGLVAYSFIYTFAIAWFSQFLPANAQFRYSIGGSNALVTVGLLMAVGILINITDARHSAVLHDIQSPTRTLKHVTRNQIH